MGGKGKDRLAGAWIMTCANFIFLTRGGRSLFKEINEHRYGRRRIEESEQEQQALPGRTKSRTIGGAEKCRYERALSMNRSLSRRSLILLLVFLASLSIAIYVLSRPRPVPGQHPLTDIQSIETLQTQFNRDAGKTRLILIASPT